MVQEFEPRVVIAVSNLETSRAFYRDVLGFAEAGKPSRGMLPFRSGKSTFSIYESEHAGSNKATAATWDVGRQLNSIVEALRAKGVTFEHYPFPGSTMDGDIHDFGEFQGVWIKDPDGNLLNLVGRR